MGWQMSTARAVAVVEAGAGHALAEAAFFDEVFFQALDLAIEEVVCLVDEADRDVCEGFGRTVFEEGAVGIEAFVGGFAEAAGIKGFSGVFRPLRQVAGAEEILVVDEEFFEARAGDVGEFEFGFGGGQRGFAAFGDVLFAGARGLHHLVDGAVASPEELLTKPEGEIIDDLGFSVGEQLAVVTALGEESFEAVGHLGGEFR